MATIEIKRSGGNYVFEPLQITIEKNDFIIWVNLDPQAAHQPTMKGKLKDYWMNEQLPSFVAGQDAATSPVINFAAGSTTEYVDGLDQSANPLVGTITVKA